MEKPEDKSSIFAFTLVELAVVLVIAAVIMSMAIGSGITFLEAQRIKVTQDRLNFIMYALNKYVETYRYIPCPSDPTLDDSSTSFGIGSGSDKDPDEAPVGAGCTALNLLGPTVTTNIIAGAVPVTTLGISPVTAEDGWGNKITYVVDRDLTFIDRANPATEGAGIATGNITIKNNAGGTITNEGAVLLISHGKNTHGAWKGKGGTIRLSIAAPSAEEEENAHISSTFDDDFVQIYSNSSFDDLLLFKTWWQIDPDQR